MSNCLKPIKMFKGDRIKPIKHNGKGRKKPMSFDVAQVTHTNIYDLLNKFGDVVGAKNKLKKIVSSVNPETWKKIIKNADASTENNIITRDLPEAKTAEEKAEQGNDILQKSVALHEILSAIENEENIQEKIGIESTVSKRTLFNDDGSRKVNFAPVAQTVGKIIAEHLGFKYSHDPVTNNAKYQKLGEDAIQRLVDAGIVRVTENDHIINPGYYKENLKDYSKQGKKVLKGYKTVSIVNDMFLEGRQVGNEKARANLSKALAKGDIEALNNFDIMSETLNGISAVNRLVVPSNVKAPNTDAAEINQDYSKPKVKDLGYDENSPGITKSHMELMEDLQEKTSYLNENSIAMLQYMKEILDELNDISTISAEATLRNMYKKMGLSTAEANAIFGSVNDNVTKDNTKSEIGKSISKQNPMLQLIMHIDDFINDYGNPKPFYHETQLYRTTRMEYLSTFLNEQMDKHFARNMVNGEAININTTTALGKALKNQLIHGIIDETGLDPKQITEEGFDPAMDYLIERYRAIFEPDYGVIDVKKQMNFMKALAKNKIGTYDISFKGNPWNKLMTIEAISDIRWDDGLFATRYRTKTDANSSGIMLSFAQAMGKDPVKKNSTERSVDDFLRDMGYFKGDSEVLIDDAYHILLNAVKAAAEDLDNPDHKTYALMVKMAELGIFNSARDIAKPMTMVTNYQAGFDTAVDTTSEELAVNVTDYMTSTKSDPKTEKFIREEILADFIKENKISESTPLGQIAHIEGVNKAIEAFFTENLSKNLRDHLDAQLDPAMGTYKKRINAAFAKIENIFLTDQADATKKNKVPLSIIPAMTWLTMSESEKTYPGEPGSKEYAEHHAKLLKKYGMPLTSRRQVMTTDSNGNNVIITKEVPNSLTASVNAIHGIDAAIYFLSHARTRKKIQEILDANEYNGEELTADERLGFRIALNNASGMIHDSNNADPYYNLVYQPIYRNLSVEASMNYDIEEQLALTYLSMKDANAKYNNDDAVESYNKASENVKKKQKALEQLDPDTARWFGFPDTEPESKMEKPGAKTETETETQTQEETVEPETKTEEQTSGNKEYDKAMDEYESKLASYYSAMEEWEQTDRNHRMPTPPEKPRYSDYVNSTNERTEEEQKAWYDNEIKKIDEELAKPNKTAKEQKRLNFRKNELLKLKSKPFEKFDPETDSTPFGSTDKVGSETKFTEKDFNDALESDNEIISEFKGSVEGNAEWSNYNPDTDGIEIAFNDDSGLSMEELIAHEIVHYQTYGYQTSEQGKRDNNVKYVTKAAKKLLSMYESDPQAMNEHLSEHAQDRLKYAMTQGDTTRMTSELISILKAEPKTAEELYNMIEQVQSKSKRNLFQKVVDNVIKKAAAWSKKVKKQDLKAMKKNGINVDLLKAAIDGVYESGVQYKKEQNPLPTTRTKSGKYSSKKSQEGRVKESYDNSKELQKIGTEEDYQNFVESIFPDSVVKDVVSHMTFVEDGDPKWYQKEGFDRKKIGSLDGRSVSGLGFYFFSNEDGEYSGLSGDMDKFNAVLNIKKPIDKSKMPIGMSKGKGYAGLAAKTLEGKDKKGFEVDKKFDTDGTGIDVNKALNKKYGYDGVVAKAYGSNNYEEFTVFDPEQVHILGSDNDIEMFREFMNNDGGKDTKTKAEPLGSTFRPQDAQKILDDSLDYNKNQDLYERKDPTEMNRIPILEDAWRTFNAEAGIYAHELLTNMLEPGSVTTIEKADEFLSDRFPVYKRNRDIVAGYWGSHESIQSIKGYVDRARVGDLAALNKLETIQLKAEQEVVNFNDNVISKLNDLMKSAKNKDGKKLTKDDIHDLQKTMAYAPVFHLANRFGDFKAILSSTNKEQKIAEMINELEKGLSEQRIKDLHDMSLVLAKKKSPGVNTSYNIEQLGITDGTREQSERLLALYTLQNTDGSTNGLDILSRNKKLSDQMVSLSTGLKQISDKVLDGTAEKSHFRENLVYEQFENPKEFKAIDENDLASGLYPSKKGWKVLRKPTGGEYGIVWRDRSKVTRQEGAGTTVDFKYNDVRVDERIKKDTAKNAISVDNGTNNPYHKVVLTEEELNSFDDLIRNPADSLARAYTQMLMAHETQAARDFIVLGDKIANPTFNDVKKLNRKLKTMKVEDHPWYIKLPDAHPPMTVDEYLAENPEIAKYYKEPEYASSINDFNKRFHLVRKDMHDMIQGYTDTEFFEGNGTAKKLAHTVRQGVVLIKTHWVIVNPEKIARDIASNNVILAAYGVPVKNMFKDQKDAFGLAKEMSDMRTEYVKLKFEDMSLSNLPKNDRKRKVSSIKLKRLERKMKNHAFAPLVNSGMIQSMSTDILRKDESVVAGLQKDIENLFNLVLKDENADPTAVADVIADFANAGWEIDGVLKWASESAENLESLVGLGNGISEAIAGSQKRISKKKKDRDVAKYLSEFIASPDSEAVRMGSYMVQMADVAAKYTLYKHLMNQREHYDPKLKKMREYTPSEIEIKVNEAFVDYKVNMPKDVKMLSDYGILLFPSFWMRIQKVMYAIAKDNPAKVAGGLLMSELLDFHIESYADSNIFTKVGTMFNEPPIFSDTKDVLPMDFYEQALPFL